MDIEATCLSVQQRLPKMVSLTLARRGEAAAAVWLGVGQAAPFVAVAGFLTRKAIWLTA